MKFITHFFQDFTRQGVQFIRTLRYERGAVRSSRDKSKLQRLQLVCLLLSANLSVAFALGGYASISMVFMVLNIPWLLSLYHMNHNKQRNAPFWIAHSGSEVFIPVVKSSGAEGWSNWNVFNAYCWAKELDPNTVHVSIAIGDHLRIEPDTRLTTPTAHPVMAIHDGDLAVFRFRYHKDAVMFKLMFA